MKLSLILPSLLSLALAQPLEHAHHEHKRDVVTVVVTQVVTRDAAAQPTASQNIVQLGNVAASAQVANAAFAVPTDSSTTILAPSVNYAPQSSTSPSASVGWSSPSSSAAWSAPSSSTSSSSKPPSGSGSIGFASGAKGITYSPYSNQGGCKDASTVASDLAKLSQFDIIRIYDTDCSSVENVFAGKGSHQKVFLGIFYLDKIQNSVSIISDTVQGDWSDVYAVGVGNELVNNGAATTGQIKSAVDQARSAFQAVGYSGPIVSVDTLVAVQNNPELCQYSDFIAVNSHPFWDGNVAPSGSGSFLKTQIANIKNVCGGKDVLICETGWPTRGDTFGSAVPSIENQITAVSSIVEQVGDQVLLFTTYNDLWKSPGPSNVEQYWGLIQD